MEKLVKELSEELLSHNYTIGTAESCTSGLISASIAAIDGSSRYFRGAVVSNATDLKTRLLDVSDGLIKSYGVVSPQVAQQMALGGLYLLDVNICVAITGYVGDDGGSQNGNVWICVGKNVGNKVSFCYKKLNVAGTRGENIKVCLKEALTLVVSFLKEENVN